MKVSIITPCLNSEKTIRETIESVLNQTYLNIEYIIVDGGSTDNTLTIIREYIPLFRGRLHVISEKDDGIYDAMNKGIKKSHGQLIGIINSNDYYDYNIHERKGFVNRKIGIITVFLLKILVGNVPYKIIKINTATSKLVRCYFYFIA